MTEPFYLPSGARAAIGTFGSAVSRRESAILGVAAATEMPMPSGDGSDVVFCDVMQAEPGGAFGRLIYRA